MTTVKLSFFIIGLLANTAYCLAPERNDYSKTEDIQVEFNNIMTNAQDKKFKIVSSSPSTTSMVNGEINLTTWGTLFFKVNNTTYSVTGQR